MLMTFKTMTMLANLPTKLTTTAGVFLIDTWTPVMIKVTAMNPEQQQCTVQQTLADNLPKVRTFWMLPGHGPNSLLLCDSFHLTNTS